MAINLPVLVGAVPLFKVQTYVVTEGYKSAAIAGSPFVQMVGLMTKTIVIDALLVGAERALRPALEALAQNPFLTPVPGIPVASTLLGAVGSGIAAAEAVVGVPVVSKNFIHVDMQITQLKFTQDNQNREALTVHLELASVPRAKLVGLIGGTADLALGVGSAFL
jgi:hypothetical protein